MTTKKVDTVVCPICNYVGQNLGWHIRSQHSLNKQEFKFLYPGHSLISETIRNRVSACSKKQWSDNYYQKKDSIHSRQARQKVKENRMKSAITMETRFKIGRGLEPILAKA